jgi:ArsR family transcriptional regulator, arsenate/arsenite/antimonite-responsive transcriptional repressor
MSETPTRAQHWAPRLGENTDELCQQILKLSPGTVSHHLSRLAEVGLLTSKKDQYYQNYSLVDGILDKTFGEVITMPPPKLAADVRQDAYRQKVKDIFFQHGRLKRIPAQRKKLGIVLEELAEAFEPERTYSEREVSLILSEFHDDFATLRRELVGYGLMARQSGSYRRVLERPAHV